MRQLTNCTQTSANNAGQISMCSYFSFVTFPFSSLNIERHLANNFFFVRIFHILSSLWLSGAFMYAISFNNVIHYLPQNSFCQQDLDSHLNMPSFRKELRGLATKAFDDLKAEILAHATGPDPWAYEPGIIERYEAKQSAKEYQCRVRCRQINEAYEHRPEESQAMAGRDTIRGSHRPGGIAFSHIISQSSATNNVERVAIDRHDVSPLNPAEYSEETKKQNQSNVRGVLRKAGLTIKPNDAENHADEYRALIGDPSPSSSTHLQRPQIQQDLGEWEAVEIEMSKAEKELMEELESQRRVDRWLDKRRRIEMWLDRVEK